MWGWKKENGNRKSGSKWGCKIGWGMEKVVKVGMENIRNKYWI